MYQKIFKPLFDFCVAFLLLVLLTPVFLLLCFLLFFANKGTVFFRQLRPGLHGSLFTILKFQTMNHKTDGNGELLPDAARLTRFGKFLRKTSLDELPQLLNVLKGELSLVGPRPLLPEYLPLYSEAQKKRHTVKPGITGWAQINGRNAISWQKRLELDAWYAENISFRLDIKILGLTFLKLFRSHDVNQPGHATMEKFTGNS